MTVTGLNHAVLWVRDARASAAFYEEALGLRGRRGRRRRAGGVPAGRRVGQPPRPRAVHRSAIARRRRRTSPGLYHLAWQVRHDRGPRRRGRRPRRARRARRGHRPRGVQEPLRQGPRRHRVRGDVAGAARGVGRSTASTPASSRSTCRPRSPAGPASRPVLTSAVRVSGIGVRAVDPAPPHWMHANARVGSAVRGRRAAPARASGGRTGSRRRAATSGSTRWPSNSRASARSRAEHELAGRTPAPAGPSGGAARRRACRRARRCGPGSAPSG